MARRSAGKCSFVGQCAAALTGKTAGVPVPEGRDPDDTKLFTCVETAGVRWLVSGDDDLLSLHRIHSIEIVSVTAFLQHLKARP